MGCNWARVDIGSDWWRVKDQKFFEAVVYNHPWLERLAASAGSLVAEMPYAPRRSALPQGGRARGHSVGGGNLGDDSPRRLCPANEERRNGC